MTQKISCKNLWRGIHATILCNTRTHHPPRPPAHPPEPTHPPSAPDTLYTSTVHPHCTNLNNSTTHQTKPAKHPSRHSRRKPQESQACQPTPQPEPQLQVPIGFDNPSTGSETERQAGEDDSQASALAEAVSSEETQNALDRAEEETFSNSEPEGDSDSEPVFNSTLQVESGLLSNEPEDDGDSGSGLKTRMMNYHWQQRLDSPFRILLRQTRVPLRGYKALYASELQLRLC